MYPTSGFQRHFKLGELSCLGIQAVALPPSLPRLQDPLYLSTGLLPAPDRIKLRAPTISSFSITILPVVLFPYCSEMRFS